MIVKLVLFEALVLVEVCDVVAAGLVLAQLAALLHARDLHHDVDDAGLAVVALHALAGALDGRRAAAGHEEQGQEHTESWSQRSHADRRAPGDWPSQGLHFDIKQYKIMT